MSNIIDVAAPGAVRVFRSIYVPRGAQSMRMYGVGRLAEYVGELFGQDQSAYGLVRFYTDTQDDGNLPPESELAGGHLETANQDETGLISEVAFTYRLRADVGWAVQLLFYNLHGNSDQDLGVAAGFLTDFRAVLQNMRVPVHIQDARFGNYITEAFDEWIDMEDDPPHTAELYSYYHFRALPLPVGITYQTLQDSVYGVWLWCLYDMRSVDMNLSNFNTPPEFPLMPSHFIGGEPMSSVQGFTLLNYDNVPLSAVIHPRMNLALREGGEEYGVGVDEYFLSGNVPTMYTEQMYDDLREAQDLQRIGGVLSSSMLAVLAYASTVNNF